MIRIRTERRRDRQRIREGALALIALAQCVLVFFGLCFSSMSQAAEPLRIGSKNFNEGYLLAELMAQQLEAAGFEVERRFGFGGTLLCYGALEAGEIDAYPEYTGTVAQAILKAEDLSIASDLAALRAALEPRGQRLLAPFGFDNTYAMVVTASTAEARGLEKISDLREQEDLRFVFSHEFLERLDGWPGLAERYKLPQRPTGIEHALAYQALEEGVIGVSDAYSTDGELVRYGLVMLQDDLAFFPDYRALPIISATLPSAARAALEALAGRIDAQTMQAMNAAVVFEQRSFADVARAFLLEAGLVSAELLPTDSWQQRMLRNTLQHLRLTGIALGAAIILALVVSLATFRRKKLAAAILYGCSLLQTIPSIALLALLLPVLGIGMVPAITALLLYALLPIVRNTLTALTTVDGTLVRVASALGLSPSQQTRQLYLPLALPGILAGVRTAAVICIGTATLAAFIGAGGLGDPIVTGLSLNQPRLIFEGAIPAALLAIATELLFELVERWLLPPHRRGG